MVSRTVGVWANSPQRVSSYLPLAKALAEAGHDCVFYHNPGFRLTDDEMADLAGAEVRPIAPEALKAESGLDVFFCSEAVWEHVPEQGVKVAIFHSLPDRDILRTNYIQWLKTRRTLVANFDYIVVAVVQKPGDWTVDAYAPEVQAARGLPGRASLASFGVIPGGYPKTDYLDARFQKAGEPDTIIYCPTISSNAAACVGDFGADILKALHEDFPEHRIVFRPYPTDDAAVIEGVIARAGPLDRLVVDRSLTGVEDQLRCAFAVTDKSSAAISFAVGSKRPAIFFEAPGEGGGPEVTENAIGYSVRGVEGLLQAAHEALRTASPWRKKIRQVRAERLYHAFDSSAYLAGAVNAIAQGQTRSNWLAVPR